MPVSTRLQSDDRSSFTAYHAVAALGVLGVHTVALAWFLSQTPHAPTIDDAPAVMVKFVELAPTPQVAKAPTPTPDNHVQPPPPPPDEDPAPKVDQQVAAVDKPVDDPKTMQVPPVVPEHPKPKVEHKIKRVVHKQPEVKTPVKPKPQPDPQPAPAPQTKADTAPPSGNPNGQDTPKGSPQPDKDQPKVIGTVSYLGDPPVPEYPEISQMRHEEGHVVIRVLIDPQGRIQKATVRTSSGYERLDQAALEALSSARFKPYTENGVAYSALADIPFDFVLRN